VFNTISLLNDVDGHLPLEKGNLTELIEIDIEDSDLSAGPVPDSIGWWTKMVKVRLRKCKLQGGFPIGVRTLRGLGMFQFFNQIDYLSLRENEFSGIIPAWIGSLNLRTLSLGLNEFSGELPIK
jgi:hypothetical protein